MKKIIFFLLVIICNKVFAQDILTEVVINGNISYLDNILNVKQINNFSNIELRILRNTIYAKYGYKFSSDDLFKHFSQFSWYEGKKINVDKELTKIDLENIKLIQKLENNYGHNVNIKDYPYRKYDINYSGVYCYKKQIMDQNIHFLSTVYYNETFNFEYEQYDKILFIKSNSGNNIIYYPFYNYKICTNIENIDSIVFSDLSNITIKGTHKKEGKKSNFFGSVEDVKVKWINTIREEIVMTYISNVTDEMIGKEIPKNKNEGRKESFFNPIAREDEKYFLFRLFDRYVVFDFSQFKESYTNIYISAIYNKTLDFYFIFVDYRDYSGDH